MTTKTHQGSCHCGAVRFEVQVDLTGATRCNCTICTKTATVGTNLKPEAFKLLAGEGDVTAYSFGHNVAQRYFCKHCGIHCFGKGHLEMLGGDFVSINLNALDGVEISDIPLKHWDGRHDNWMAGMRDVPWPIGVGA